MDDVVAAYLAGREDGMAGQRDTGRTEDPLTGPDYRVGFIDGRIAMFHITAQLRRWLAEDAE